MHDQMVFASCRFFNRSSKYHVYVGEALQGKREQPSCLVCRFAIGENMSIKKIHQLSYNIEIFRPG